MKIVKKVSMVFVSILLGLLFIFSVYNFVSLKVFKNDLSSIFGYSILEVVSGSMEPTIHIGDLIIINKNETNYQANDIVTFYDRDGSFVTHRIVSIEDDKMVTKGDHNNSEDDALPLSNIVGKYVTRVPLVGRLLSSLKNPFVLFMIFLLGVLICYFLSIDKDGKIILTEEEKEYEEFLLYQKNNNGKIKDISLDEKKNVKIQQPVNKKKNSSSKQTKNVTKTKNVGNSSKKSNSKKTSSTKGGVKNKKSR